MFINCHRDVNFTPANLSIGRNSDTMMRDFSFMALHKNYLPSGSSHHQQAIENLPKPASFGSLVGIQSSQSQIATHVYPLRRAQHFSIRKMVDGSHSTISESSTDSGCPLSPPDISVIGPSVSNNTDDDELIFLDCEDRYLQPNVSSQTDKYFSVGSANMISSETCRPLQKDQEDECLIQPYTNSPRINCFKKFPNSHSLPSFSNDVNVSPAKNIYYRRMSSSFEFFDQIQSQMIAYEVSIPLPDNEHPLNEHSPNDYTYTLRSELFWLKQTIIQTLKWFFRQV